VANGLCVHTVAETIHDIDEVVAMAVITHLPFSTDRLISFWHLFVVRGMSVHRFSNNQLCARCRVIIVRMSKHHMLESQLKASG
jgi:hypothetical protein